MVQDGSKKLSAHYFFIFQPYGNKFERPIYIYLYWHIKKRGLPTKEKKDKKRKIG